MNTAPGIIPCSYSSGSRTSRNVASPRRASASSGSISRISDLVCFEQLSEARHRRDSSWLVERVNPTAAVGYSQPGVRPARRPAPGAPSPSWSRTHDVGDRVERRLLGVDDHEPGAVAQRDLGQRGRRVDAERRADREEHVGAAGRELRPLEVVGHEVLAEADRRRLQDPAALEARRVVLAGAHPVEGLVHRAAPAARHALRLAHVAVDLDDDLGRRARPRGAGRRCSG